VRLVLVSATAGCGGENRWQDGHAGETRWAWLVSDNGVRSGRTSRCSRRVGTTAFRELSLINRFLFPRCSSAPQQT
jgi:hypothetical protein